VQLGVPAEKGGGRAVPAFLPAADVERLVQVADEVHQEAQRLVSFLSDAVVAGLRPMDRSRTDPVRSAVGRYCRTSPEISVCLVKATKAVTVAIAYTVGIRQASGVVEDRVHYAGIVRAHLAEDARLRLVVSRVGVV